MALTDRDRACYGPRNQKALGSVSWCWQTLDLLKIRWQRRDFTEQQFQETLEELREQEVWNVVPPEQPYGSLEALLEAEIGCDEKTAKGQLLAQKTSRWDKAVTGNLPVTTQVQRAEHNGVSVRTQRKLDTIADYVDPLLLAQVEAKLLPVDKAWRIATGKVPDTPIQKLKRAWDALSAAEKQRFFADVCPEAADLTLACPRCGFDPASGQSPNA